MKDIKDLPRSEDGTVLDEARVEMSVPWLRFPLLRFRFYLSHQPEDHLTVWQIVPIHRFVGGWNPPRWFLKLTNQIKE